MQKIIFYSNGIDNHVVTIQKQEEITAVIKSVLLIPKQAACCGMIDASEKPGTVFTSTTCGIPF